MDKTVASKESKEIDINIESSFTRLELCIRIFHKDH